MLTAEMRSKWRRALCHKKTFVFLFTITMGISIFMMYLQWMKVPDMSQPGDNRLTKARITGNLKDTNSDIFLFISDYHVKSTQQESNTDDFYNKMCNFFANHSVQLLTTISTPHVKMLFHYCNDFYFNGKNRLDYLQPTNVYIHSADQFDKSIHEQAFDAYLHNVGYFIFTAPNSSIDLVQFLADCTNHGAFISKYGDVCVNVAHYEALGYIYPVGQAYSAFSMVGSFPESFLDLTYRAWIPWLYCLHGSRIADGSVLQANCKTSDLQRSLVSQRNLLALWQLEESPMLPEPNTKVISMSLYGSNLKYNYGALRNAVLARIFFAGWQMRFYTQSNSKNELLIAKLRFLGAVVQDVASNSATPPMMWRFLIADDPNVDVFIVRDSDSRLGPRGRAIVDDWLKTNTTFHCIRDHPSHSRFPVSGGIWGARRAQLALVLQKPFSEWTSGKSGGYLADMNMLRNAIWPIVTPHAYCHDAFSCDKYPSSHPMPVARLGTEHLGQVFDEYDVPREGDMAIIRTAAVNRNCSPA